MKHYGISKWVDFARGLMSTEEAAAMRNHSADCVNCRNAAGYCAGLVRIGAGMMQEEVPETAILRARSVFRVRSSGSGLSRIGAALVDDRPAADEAHMRLSQSRKRQGESKTALLSV